MPGALKLAVLDALLPGGLSFGAVYLVEFEPQSLWYETSLTMSGQALKQGARTVYHTLMHLPEDVRQGLARQGVDVEKAEEDGIFHIIDSYTPSTGLDLPAGKGKASRASLKLADWSMSDKSSIEKPKEAEKRWLHIDDDLSILLRHNDENEFHRNRRDRAIPWARALELALFQPIAAGIYSRSFYGQMESVCDGIIDFKTKEDGGVVENYVRVRMMRGKSHDSSWRLLRVRDNGEVAVEPTPRVGGSLGIKGWLKGPKKQV